MNTENSIAKQKGGNNIRSIIYGAGSMGTVLGALLSRAGEDVTLVSRNREHVDALNKTGAEITGGICETIPVKAALPDGLSGRYDVIMLMTKQHDNPRNAEFLRPFLASDGMICTSQNGYPELSLRGVIPDDQIAGCIIYWSATRKGPGQSELTSPADSVRFTIGSPFSQNAQGLKKVQRLLSAAGLTDIDTDLFSLRWSKLLVNCAVSAVSSSVGCLCGAAANDEKLQVISLLTLKEVVDVGHAQGAVFRPVAGYDIASLLYVNGPEDIKSRALLMPEVFESINDAKSSVLQDLQAGRKTEVREITGAVCRSAAAVGIKTPFNDRVMEIIERIERNELPISYANITEYNDLTADLRFV